jgi:hypothetical protein
MMDELLSALLMPRAASVRGEDCGEAFASP